MSENNPFGVRSFEQIDEEVRRRRCHCGGRYQTLGESSLGEPPLMLRAVRLECRFCEEIVRLYFDLSGLYH